MLEKHKDITDELRRNSAAMGMVFFGLKYGKRIPNLEKYMETGMSVCDIIIKGQTVPKSGVPKYEDRAVRDAFIRVASHQSTHQQGPATSEEETVKRAELTRRTLKQLMDRGSVSDQDLDASADFFRKIYSAT